jgi:hypothetical protein
MGYTPGQFVAEIPVGTKSSEATDKSVYQNI